MVGGPFFRIQTTDGAVSMHRRRIIPPGLTTRRISLNHSSCILSDK
jgi:hypothetical protein